MPRKPDFSTQVTVHWYYIAPSSTNVGGWVNHIVYALEDSLKLAEIMKQTEEKEQRKRDRGMK
jgi:hypothetical protein